MEFYRKDIRSIDNIWNSKQNDFSTWEDIQNKFNLTSTEVRDWGKLQTNSRKNDTGSLKRTRTPLIQLNGLGCT